tara:strand:- start:411 stop:602 length:192 start_codon:yes stop_codon:yes gene_type:complete
MNEDKISMDVAYLRGIIQQELKAALAKYAKRNNCTIQQALELMNQIAIAGKGDLYDPKQNRQA